MIISAPKIELTPQSCQTVTGFEVKNRQNPNDPLPDFISIANDNSAVLVQTSDNKFLGTHDFTISAITSNGLRI